MIPPSLAAAFSRASRVRVASPGQNRTDSNLSCEAGGIQQFVLDTKTMSAEPTHNWHRPTDRPIHRGIIDVNALLLLTAHSAPVYSRSNRGIKALQSRMVLMVH